MTANHKLNSSQMKMPASWYYRGPRTFNPVSLLRSVWFDAVHAPRPPHDINCRVAGCRLQLRSDSVIGRVLYIGTGFENAELLAFRRLLKPGMRVLDIGANIGVYTAISSRAVGPQGYVWSFEPCPATLGYIQKNVRANELDNVTVVGKAVAEKTGTMNLNLFPDGADVYNSLGAQEPPDENVRSVGVIPVATITLDDFAHEQRIESVDLIKIDVEGAEERVVAGARNLLKHSPNVVLMMELWEPSAAQCGCSTRRLISTLVDQGFSMFAIGKRGDLNPVSPAEFDGKYAAFRRI